MDPHLEEIAALRRMTPAEKLAVMRSLIREAYRLKAPRAPKPPSPRP